MLVFILIISSLNESNDTVHIVCCGILTIIKNGENLTGIDIDYWNVGIVTTVKQST